MCNCAWHHLRSQSLAMIRDQIAYNTLVIITMCVLIIKGYEIEICISIYRLFSKAGYNSTSTVDKEISQSYRAGSPHHAHFGTF